MANPAGVPAAVTDEPMLTDIPGTLIDYVPQVATNLNIDVPGQYYEILPRFYVFIPNQDSAANPTLRTLKPADLPIVEAYVRAIASMWRAYSADPVPAGGTPEMRAAFTEAGLAYQETILKASAGRGGRTFIRSGNIVVPRVNDGRVVLDCSWLDQYENDSAGRVFEDTDSEFGIRAVVVRTTPLARVDSLYNDETACSR